MTSRRWQWNACLALSLTHVRVALVCSKWAAGMRVHVTYDNTSAAAIASQRVEEQFAEPQQPAPSFFVAF